MTGGGSRTSPPEGVRACPYHFIFETKINDDVFMFLRNAPSVPHPYLLEPPLADQKEYRAGDALSFTIRLFGAATDYAINIIEAVMLFGRNGITYSRTPFRILRVSSSDATGKKRLLYDGASNRYSSIPRPYHWKPDPNADSADELTIRFRSPARLVQSQHLHENVDFSIIATSIVRRLAALAYYAEGLKRAAKLTDGRLIRVEGVVTSGQNTKWIDYRRYSSRQSTAMLFGGIIGEVTFTSVPEDYLQLLQFGTLLHLGKQTTFGLGKYEVIQK